MIPKVPKIAPSNLNPEKQELLDFFHKKVLSKPEKPVVPTIQPRPVVPPPPIQPITPKPIVKPNPPVEAEPMIEPEVVHEPMKRAADPLPPERLDNPELLLLEEPIVPDMIKEPDPVAEPEPEPALEEMPQRIVKERNKKGKVTSLKFVYGDRTVVLGMYGDTIEVGEIQHGEETAETSE